MPPTPSRRRPPPHTKIQKVWVWVPFSCRFFSPCEEFLVFCAFSPFFFGDSWGLVGIKDPNFLGGWFSLLFLSKKSQKRKDRIGASEMITKFQTIKFANSLTTHTPLIQGVEVHLLNLRVQNHLFHCVFLSPTPLIKGGETPPP